MVFDADRFVIVKGHKEDYFIQDTHYDKLRFGSYLNDQSCKEDCEWLNDKIELIEELHVSDRMGWEKVECYKKELHNKKIYIDRLEYKVSKFKEWNYALSEENESLKKELDKIPVKIREVWLDD